MVAGEGPGGANAKRMVSVSGDQLAGLNVNFRMGLYNETGNWYPDKGSMVHPYDTCLIFFGHNVDDLSYLGAELTIEIGKGHEQHIIDVPTVVSIPRGTPYLPVNCTRLERPYRVMQVGLAAKYESEWVD
jgi:hypothetical protein